nr:hypothetical protein [Streptomyces sp. DSM 41633]
MTAAAKEEATSSRTAAGPATSTRTAVNTGPAPASRGSTASVSSGADGIASTRDRVVAYIET